MLIAIGGFSGSGKSYTSFKLSDKLKCPSINSDKIRKELSNISMTQKVYENFGEGIYSESFTKVTYNELIKKAIKLTKNSKNLIIDATFISKDSQKLIIDNFQDYIFIFCYADEDIIKDRLDKRVKKKTISDGRWEIYQKQKDTFEGFIIPEDKIIKINTGKEGYLDELYRLISEKLGEF